jgi:hypothetical protein
MWEGVGRIQGLQKIIGESFDATFATLAKFRDVGRWLGEVGL